MADPFSRPPERDFDFVRVAIDDAIELMERRKKELSEKARQDRVDAAIARLQECKKGIETDIFISPPWFMIFAEHKEKI